MKPSLKARLFRATKNISRNGFFLSCLLVFSSAFAQVNVLTQHNDNNRTGDNLQETTLTTSNVNQTNFGKLFSCAVDDQIYGQPLYVANVAIAGGAHNVVYVATVNDSVYAFDADNAGSGTPLWVVHYTNGSSIVPPNHTQVGGACGTYLDFSGNIGIVGSPVINLANNAIYFVVRTVENGTWFQRLHALDIRSGAEMPNSPVNIQASVPGTGAGSVGGTLTFDTQIHNQRAALALAGSTVYICWASHCDTGNYHGWVMGYNATSLQQTLVYNDMPDGIAGGIWQAGAAPAIDASGNLYFLTGNGDFNADTGGNNMGDSFVKLNSSLARQDWFTPFNQATLNGADNDLGSGGCLLLPGTSLLVGGGKESKLYLLNMGNLGHFNSTTDQVTQEFFVNTDTSNTHHIHGAPTYWNGPNGAMVYVWVENDVLKAYSFNGSSFNTTPASQSTFTDPNGMPGAMMSLSANGGNSGSGILWCNLPFSGNANNAVVPGVLRAFDASNVATELWNNQQNASRDGSGNFAKFSYPTVANGKVYLATFSNQLIVYGLLGSTSPTPTKTPTPTGGQTTWRVNAGGPAYTDSLGNAWAADENFSGGTAAVTTSAISNTSDPTLYQTERFGASTYTFPVPAGNYQVTLKFAEFYWTAAGQRVFNVSINGTQVLTNFDIFADSGAQNKADDKVFTNVSPSNGQITVQFVTGTVDLPKVSAIQIVPQVGTNPTNTPTRTFTPTMTPTPSSVGTSTWRVNAGGPAYTDSLGHAWAADENFSGGTAAVTTSAISNTSDPTLYQTERFGASTYTFSVPAGNYQVTLKFAEFYWTAAGQRIFNVSINGTQVLTNFDIFADSGAQNKADDKVFSNIAANSSGQIVIQFNTGSADLPKVSAIQIVPQGGTVPTNTFTNTPTKTPTPTNTPPGAPTNTFTNTPTRTFTPTPTFTSGGTSGSTWRILAGNSSSYTDCQGKLWAADSNFSGGNTNGNTNTITKALPCTTDQKIYQNERWGNPFTYTFSVTPGNYQVTLKFAEIFDNAAGQRIENISINGTLVLANFDIFSDAGGLNIADDKVFSNIASNSSGQIVVQVAAASTSPDQNAKISGIQIISQGGSVPTNTPTKTLTPTPPNAFTNTPTRTTSAKANKDPFLSGTGMSIRTTSPTFALSVLM